LGSNKLDKGNPMAANKVQFQFSLEYIEPAEYMVSVARKFADSPDENRRAVAKALLDVSAAGLAVKKAMEPRTDTESAMKANTNTDMAPYLDFWFADAISSAQKLLRYDDAESRDLAQCLIDAEKAVMKSKESVLAEIKRLGLKRSNG
jgi:hypothetical protein